MPEDFERTDRVSQKLQEILARALLKEVQDPRLERVEITDVEVSPDLRESQVYWVSILETDESERREIQRALGDAKGFLKRHVGERLDTKYTPDLDFRYDESLERGRRIEELLDEAAGTDGSEGPGDA